MCQQLVTHSVDLGGLDADRRLHDKHCTKPLSGQDYVHAQYVDNLIVVGSAAEEVTPLLKVGRRNQVGLDLAPTWHARSRPQEPRRKGRPPRQGPP